MSAKVPQLVALLALGCSCGTPAVSDGAQDARPEVQVPLWSCAAPGLACDAHDPCAINPVCGEDLLCRPAGLQSCDDGLTCTTDVCQGGGRFGHEPAAGTCALPVKSGQQTVIRCFVAGAADPENPCRRCDPQQDPSGWTPAAGVCDDKDPCTMDDHCTDGDCQGTDYRDACADPYSCTEDLCDGKGGCLGSQLKSDWCLVDNVCYAHQAKRPDGSCYACDVKQSQSAWSPITSHCIIDGACWATGDKHPGGCAVCDPAVNATAWTATGSACFIDNICRTPGQTDPSGCRSCDPTRDKNGWTALPGVCAIDGMCFAAGAVHPDGCGTCDPATSLTSWTPTKGCVINYACYAAGDKHPAGCGACDPTQSATSWTVPGASCLVGRTCLAASAAEPGGCGVCDPAQSKTSWTRPPGCLATQGWSTRWGGITNDGAGGVAVDSHGNIYVIGQFNVTVDLGGGPLASKGKSDVFLASFTPSGKHRWSKAFGSDGTEEGHGVVVDGDDNVYITGYFQSENYVYAVSFGGSPLNGKGDADVFLASFTSGGAHRWSKSFGGSSDDRAAGIAVDGQGNLYVTGYFKYTADFGGGPLTSNGNVDMFVASFTSGGKPRWSKSFGGANIEYGTAVGADAAGNAYVTGYFSKDITLGGSNLTGNGGGDILLASFTGGGTHRWSKNLGAAGAGAARGVAVDGGSCYITGYFSQAIDLGGGPLVSNGYYDLFVAAFTNDGVHRWSRGHGSTTSDFGQRIAAHGDSVCVLGEFQGTVDFGGGPLTSAGATDVVLLKIVQ